MRWLMMLCIACISIDLAKAQVQPTTRPADFPDAGRLDWLQRFPEGVSRVYHCVHEAQLLNNATQKLETEYRVEGIVRLTMKRKLSNGGAEMLCELCPSTFYVGGKTETIGEARTLPVVFSQDGGQTINREEAAKAMSGQRGSAYNALLKMLQVLSYGTPNASVRTENGILTWQGAPGAGGYNYSARLLGGAEIVSWHSSAGELPNAAFIFNGNCVLYDGIIHVGTLSVSAWTSPHRVAKTLILHAELQE